MLPKVNERFKLGDRIYILPKGIIKRTYGIVEKPTDAFLNGAFLRIRADSIVWARWEDNNMLHWTRDSDVALADVGIPENVVSNVGQELKNNDGRSTCYSCDSPTKRVDTGIKFYDVCTKCKK